MSVNVSLMDLILAINFVSENLTGFEEAYVSRKTGVIHMRGYDDADLDKCPEDVENESLYVPVPTTSQLSLGRSVAVGFADECLPEYADDIREIFSRNGAFKRFRSFLVRTGNLEKWYEYENETRTRILTAWAEKQGFTLEK